MDKLCHELTMLYLTNSTDLLKSKDPSEYLEAYLKANKEIKAKYNEINQSTKQTERPKGSRKIISKGI